jgi:hypothetical protein
MPVVHLVPQNKHFAPVGQHSPLSNLST